MHATRVYWTDPDHTAQLRLAHNACGLNTALNSNSRALIVIVKESHADPVALLSQKAVS